MGRFVVKLPPNCTDSDLQCVARQFKNATITDDGVCVSDTSLDEIESHLTNAGILNTKYTIQQIPLDVAVEKPVADADDAKTESSETSEVETEPEPEVKSKPEPEEHASAEPAEPAELSFEDILAAGDESDSTLAKPSSTTTQQASSRFADQPAGTTATVNVPAPVTSAVSQSAASASVDAIADDSLAAVKTLNLSDAINDVAMDKSIIEHSVEAVNKVAGNVLTPSYDQLSSEQNEPSSVVANGAVTSGSSQRLVEYFSELAKLQSAFDDDLDCISQLSKDEYYSVQEASQKVLTLVDPNSYTNVTQAQTALKAETAALQSGLADIRALYYQKLKDAGIAAAEQAIKQLAVQLRPQFDAAMKQVTDQSVNNVSNLSTNCSAISLDLLSRARRFLRTKKLQPQVGDCDINLVKAYLDVMQFRELTAELAAQLTKSLSEDKQRVDEIQQLREQLQQLQQQQQQLQQQPLQQMQPQPQPQPQQQPEQQQFQQIPLEQLVDQGVAAAAAQVPKHAADATTAAPLVDNSTPNDKPSLSREERLEQAASDLDSADLALDNPEDVQLDGDEADGPKHAAHDADDSANDFDDIDTDSLKQALQESRAKAAAHKPADEDGDDFDDLYDDEDEDEDAETEHAKHLDKDAESNEEDEKAKHSKDKDDKKPQKKEPMLKRVLIRVGLGFAIVIVLGAGAVFAAAQMGLFQPSPAEQEQAADKADLDERLNAVKQHLAVGDALTVADDNGSTRQVTLTRWTDKGALAKDQNGKEWLITVDQLEQFVASQPDDTPDKTSSKSKSDKQRKEDADADAAGAPLPSSKSNSAAKSDVKSDAKSDAKSGAADKQAKPAAPAAAAANKANANKATITSIPTPRTGD